MSDQVTVMKFGGTSLEDAFAFERVAHIVESSVSSRLVLVVSAMSGVTDALINTFQRAAKSETSGLQTLEHHFERHLNVAGTLGSTAHERMRLILESCRKEIVEILSKAGGGRNSTAAGQDAMACQGERLSAHLLTIVLEEFGIRSAYVDARRCILTNAEHGTAKPLMVETEMRLRAELLPLLEAKRIPVMAGFSGATHDGAPTTLGRGSSNYSATLVSAALGACETQIWTDVDGVKTADPNLVKTARTVSRLSYDEAAELARLGAGVLHSNMFEPVRALEIPIRICDSRSPEKSGTLISSRTEASGFSVKAIAHKTNLTTINITSTPAFVANGFMHAIEEIFARRGTAMNLVAMSADGVSCTQDGDDSLSSIVEDLSKLGTVTTERHRAIIGCVGADLNTTTAQAANARRILNEIDPTLNWRSTSISNLIAVVNAANVDQAVKNLHQGIFECD